MATNRGSPGKAVAVNKLVRLVLKRTLKLGHRNLGRTLLRGPLLLLAFGVRLLSRLQSFPQTLLALR